MKSFCPRDLKTYYTWGPWILQLVRRRVLSIQESLWIAGERSLWRFGSLPWRLTKVIGWGLSVLNSRGIRWRHNLLSWISASLTRHTVVTATGTSPTNPLSSSSNWFYPTSLALLTVCLCEVFATCLICLTSLCEDYYLFGFILSSPDPIYLAAYSLRAFTSLLTWLWLV